MTTRERLTALDAASNASDEMRFMRPARDE